MSNMWALVNCSARMCQSDKGWFMALEQQGQKLPSLELCYLHSIGGLEDGWKTFPWSGVKIKMVPQPSPVSDHIFKMWKKILLSHLIDVRSVNNIDLSNLHSLAYQLEKVLIPCQLYVRITMMKITHISKPDIFSPLLQQQIGGDSIAHVWPYFLQVHYSSGGNFNLSFN